MEEIVTFNIAPLSLFMKKSGKVLLSKQGDEVLYEMKLFFEEFEQKKQHILAQLGDEMEQRGLSAVRGEKTAITTSYVGTRYNVADKELALQSGTAKEMAISQVRPDVKAIDEYVNKTGELPEGIAYRERTRKVEIKDLTK